MEWREGSGFLLLSQCSVLHGCISEESGELVTIIIITGNLNKIFSRNEIIKKQRHGHLCTMAAVSWNEDFFSQTIKFALEKISVSI